MSSQLGYEVADPESPPENGETSGSQTSRDEEKIIEDEEQEEWRKIREKFRKLSEYNRSPHRHLGSRFSLGDISGIHGGPPEHRSFVLQQDLLSIVQYYFGHYLKATICDIGPSNSEPLKDVSIDELPQFWTEPLDPDTIRWIHVPIGPGKRQDSLTQDFVMAGGSLGEQSEIFHGKRRTSIHSQANRYECEILNLRTLRGVQETYDVLDLVRRWFDRDTTIDSKNLLQYFRKEPLSTSLGQRLLYANNYESAVIQLAHSKLPCDLGSGFPTGFRGWDFETWPFDAKLIEQTLSDHSRFKDAILVKDPLHCVYRERVIMTFSPCRGVSYIHGRLNSELKKPPMKAGKSDLSSVIPKVQHEFLSSGTQFWPSRTVEWFMVYLMTEILKTPLDPREPTRPDKQTEIQDAYQSIVWNLKRRCQIGHNRGNPTDLAIKYVACINELTELVRAFEDKKRALARLKEHCQIINDPSEQDHLRPNKNSELPSAKQMIEKALTTLESIGHLLPGLRAEMESSLATFYHFRNIEQDVLQKLSERNNRTMLVFTATTIIFLPLSFFTSYFGMNLSDLTNTVHTQKYFWSVCGTIALIIVFGTFCYAMKERLIEGGGRFVQSIRAFLQRVRDYFRRMH